MAKLAALVVGFEAVEHCHLRYSHDNPADLFVSHQQNAVHLVGYLNSHTPYPALYRVKTVHLTNKKPNKPQPICDKQ